MTIRLTTEQEAAVRQAIHTGQVSSVEELIDWALAVLSSKSEEETPTIQTVFEQGLGLFGKRDDAALLDEVVSMAYEERHLPSKREPPS